MSTLTTILKLIKHEDNDNVRQGETIDASANMDIIDALFDPATGHRHGGSGEDGRKVLATDLDPTGGAALQLLRVKSDESGLEWGLVTSDNLADGAATGSKLGSDVVRTSDLPRGLLARVVVDVYSTSSGTWVDVPGSTFTISSGSRPLRFTVVSVIDGTVTGSRGFMKLVDTSTSEELVSLYGIVVNSNGPTVCGVDIRTLSSGDHTLKLQVYTENGNTMRVVSPVVLVEEI